MTNEAIIIDTTNGKRISALFPIECAAHEISVDALNVCGRTPATSPFTLAQTPSHSLTELGLLPYTTNSK